MSTNSWRKALQVFLGIVATATLPKGSTVTPEALESAVIRAHQRGALTDAEAIGASIAIPKRGRPPTGAAKKAVTVRLDKDVAEALESREDWRSEVNAVLRKHLGL